jgi:hypothetical protein
MTQNHNKPNYNKLIPKAKSTIAIPDSNYGTKINILKNSELRPPAPFFNHGNSVS